MDLLVREPYCDHNNGHVIDPLPDTSHHAKFFPCIASFNILDNPTESTVIISILYIRK